MKNISIRVDGNSDIATGHITRCLTIARALLSETNNNIIPQIRVNFIVSDENSRAMLTERFTVCDEFDIFVLNTNYKDMVSETESLVDLISQIDASCLFIDSYFVSEEYFTSLHKELSSRGCTIAYLDDLQALLSYDIDVIINYGISVTPSIYSSVQTKLIGNHYIPLRPQFVDNIKENFNDPISDIFVSTGGTDHLNLCTALINTLGNSYNYHILTSTWNLHYDTLVSLAEQNTNIHIYQGISDVATIMKGCDIAICAGGTTVNELCALGIPTIAFLSADNQRSGLMELAKQQVILYAGEPDQSGNINQLLANIHLLVDELYLYTPQKRMSLQNRMTSYIDARGAKRIADCLLQ